MSASSFSCLATSVTQPAPKLSHASMVTGPRAEQRPDRHLHRAGVGRGDDAEPVVGGQPQQRVRALDRFVQARLAERRRGASGRARACRAVSGLQPGGLAHGPDEKCGLADVAVGRRTSRRQSYQSIQLSSQRARAALGRRGPPPVLSGECGRTASAERERFRDAAAHNSLILLESPSYRRRFERFTAVSGRLVPARGT